MAKMFFSTSEVADLFNVNRVTIYRWVKEGMVKGYKVGKHLKIPLAEVERLKREFGRDIVFWGGGVNTQQTIAFGTPGEVYAEVRERIEIFNEDGGFVFNSIHNIQANTPTANMLAMFQAVRDSAH